MSRSIAYLQFQNMENSSFDLIKQLLCQEKDVWYKIDISTIELPYTLVDYDLIIIADEISNQQDQQTFKKINILVQLVKNLQSLTLLGVGPGFEIILQSLGQTIERLDNSEQDYLQASDDLKSWDGYNDLLDGNQLKVSMSPKYFMRSVQIEDMKVLATFLSSPGMISIGQGNILVVQGLAQEVQGRYLCNVINRWLHDHQKMIGNAQLIASTEYLININQKLQREQEERVVLVGGMKAFASGMREKKKQLNLQLKFGLIAIEQQLQDISSQVAELESQSNYLLNSLTNVS
eukprot:TRINITY_DN10923_c0_g2_i2.p2 TRINITY_DN10923_c0_g2~~TRINITY_DN10923_c0_g2_i2.p2  ORF type:complete len:335 (-),score=26.37 TRINITY_DN10923_c0_g2_i2:386-1258(-)